LYTIRAIAGFSKEVDMRTRLTTLVLTVAALAGCATAPRVQRVEPEAPPPLSVWIGYPIGSSRVHPLFTNREAHVAMFEIIPGLGATMVYPFARGHTLASEAHYADLTVQPARMFYHTDPFGHAAYQPRYYYAVASVAPLNLTRLQASLGGMRHVLGRTYASYRPYEVIDRLTALVVPMQPDADWATDLFVDWPGFPMTRYASTRLVRCANGRVFEVPLSYPYFGCPGDAEPVVVATSVPVPLVPPKADTVHMPRAPRAPGAGGRDGVELSDPGDKRRRAEAGARIPSARTRDRSGREGIHYSDYRASGHSPKPSDRGAWSAGSSDRPQAAGRGSADGSRSSERGEPASKPATTGGGESGKERKP
jgi:hypothetical protein